MTKKPKVNYDLLDAEILRRSFFKFLKEFWPVIIPEEPVYNWHIEYLCNHLSDMVHRIGRRERKRGDTIINIPPGLTKSTICTVMLPVWAWTVDPRIRVLTASYSQSLSVDHSTKSRDIIRSDRFRQLFPEIQIRKDVDNKSHFKNTAGGERMATSVTGTITGFHAHLLIVDDPLNPKEASSEVERTRANDFMNITLSTRKVDKAVTPTVLVMQRLHQDDCTGNLLERRVDINHINLPAELEDTVSPHECKAFYVDGLLDPLRLNRDILTESLATLGSYGYAGQMLQRPAPADGGIWKRWFKAIEPKDIPKDLHTVGTDWDLAYTEKEINSASAYVTAGLHEGKMYILDAGFRWLEFPNLVEYMTAKSAPHYIESKASGKSAKQTLTNRGIPAIEVDVTGGDKVGRAMLATPYAEGGLVFCNARILEMIYSDPKQGILIFPNGTGDDLQDALVQSINRLLNKHQQFVF